MKREFVTCLNCIDGRVQLPVIHWIMANYEVKYIDMITTPGMDGILADRNSNIEDILEKVNVSREVHSTDYIFIVGHHDCLANPVKDETHKKQIIDAVDHIKELNSSCNVIGLWVDSKSMIKIVYNI
jgi:carbonic anhydrase